MCFLSWKKKCLIFSTDLVTAVSQKYCKNFGHFEQVEHVENLLQIYLPSQFLHNLLPFFTMRKKMKYSFFLIKLMIRITIFAFTVWIHTKPRSVFALYFPYYLSPVIRKCTDKYMWLAKIWISQHSHTVWSFFSKNSIRLCSSHHKNMPI